MATPGDSDRKDLAIDVVLYQLIINLTRLRTIVASFFSPQLLVAWCGGLLSRTSFWSAMVIARLLYPILR